MKARKKNLNEIPREIALWNGIIESIVSFSFVETPFSSRLHRSSPDSFVHLVIRIGRNGDAPRFIYVMKVTRHIEVGGSMGREDAEERVCEDEERRGRSGSTMVLNGTGFILRLRTSGTFDVTLCWWMAVKVVLLVNGGNGRLKRAFAAKIRSLLANKPTVSPATSIPIIAFQ